MSKTSLKKLAFIITLPLAFVALPIILGLVCWVIEKVSPPDPMDYTAFGETWFAIILLSIPVGIVIFVPIWVIFAVKFFRKVNREPEKEEHVIENITREEAVARMKERYRQDAERNK